MTFNSVSFFAFFPLAVLVCRLVPRRWQNSALLAVSYAFYCFNTPAWLPVLVLDSLATWALVRRMDAEGHQIGIHTYDHVKLTGLNRADFDDQVDKTRQLLKNVLGHNGNGAQRKLRLEAESGKRAGDFEGKCKGKEKSHQGAGLFQKSQQPRIQ